MTYKEMYDSLAADKIKVDIKKEYLRPKAIKVFRKARKFPAWEMFEYKIPSTNNQYIIYFYAESRLYIEKPIVGSFCIVFDKNERYIITWGASGYKHTPNSSIKGIRQINAYTSHFIERYNERIIKDNSLSNNEIICRYLSRNTIAMPIPLNKDINRNYEKYGDNGQLAFRVRDGFAFTHSDVEGITSNDGNRENDKIDSICVIHTTFMNESDMAESQISAIEEEHLTSWTQFWNDFQKQAINGVMTLKLNP